MQLEKLCDQQLLVLPIRIGDPSVHQQHQKPYDGEGFEDAEEYYASTLDFIFVDVVFLDLQQQKCHKNQHDDMAYGQNNHRERLPRTKIASAPLGPTDGDIRAYCGETVEIVDVASEDLHSLKFQK